MKRRSPLWLSAFLAGHIVQYLGFTLQVATADGGLRYVVYAGCALQIAASMLAAQALPGWARALLGACLSYLACQLVLGYLNNNWISYILVDVLCLGLLVTARAGATPGVMARLVRIYGYLLIPGTLVAVVAVSQLSPATADERLPSEMGYDAFHIWRLVAPGLFILLVDDRQVPLRRVVSTGALVVMCLYGVLTATRSALVVPILASLLHLARTKSRFRTALLLGSFVLGAAYLSTRYWSQEGLSDAASFLSERFEADDFSAGRKDEAEVFWAQLETREVLFGKGLGGSYFGLIPGHEVYGIAMVHYGHLHLVLKGGVMLVALIGALLAAVVWNAFRRGVGLTAEVALVLVFVVMNGSHTEFITTPMLALVSASIGSGLARHGPVRARAD